MQTATQAADIGRRPALPQGAWQYPAPRAKRIAPHWNSAPFRHIRPIRDTLTSLEVQALTGEFGISQQHRVIATVAPILKRLNHSDNLPINPDMPTWGVLAAVIDEINRMAGHYEWRIVKDGIEVCYLYDDIEPLLACALHWLPRVEKLNPNLHQLAVKTLGLLCSQAGMHFSVDWHLEMLEERLNEDEDYDDLETRSDIRATINEYTTGQAARYLELIHSTKPTPDPLLAALEEFKPAHAWERTLILWLRHGFQVAATGKLDDFIDEHLIANRFDDCMPPWEYIRMVWSPDDLITTELLDYCDSYWNSTGFAPLSWSDTITATKGSFEPGYAPQWPYLLKGFLTDYENVEQEVNEAWNTPRLKQIHFDWHKC